MAVPPPEGASQRVFEHAGNVTCAIAGVVLSSQATASPRVLCEHYHKEASEMLEDWRIQGTCLQGKEEAA